ncbi:FHA domain-containing protein [Salinibacterium sp. NSLL150]|uniref:FHA domain-containing protein FhaB/FipA n=1 Tax=unclassified Salinibacterium TaxID=2632331 RepID=UPI0018CCB066|nr:MULTISPECIES: FHA domain-containing protein [unclassified Salinibacterium]MBH0097724.1 FHA domain-containing protein [Salinibacterium sp. NSLL35]MBH0100479.1 FHA domain-containing protein [Salinibacterium sp. NSLL150]MBH0103238.1 FHA domain-containing protein [Salinibacterium sp. NSLL16]MBH0105999.1 FHA domain-containing protein [Salinibacterium sp. NSLL17]
MSELTLLLLRVAFLAIMWGFIFAIVYALRSDLFGEKVRRMPVQSAAQAQQAAAPTAPAPAAAQPTRPVAPAPADGSSLDATRLVIVSGSKEGLEISLPEEQLTIGRSSESGLVIRDDYTSTHHARLLRWADSWVVQDLDSTNGTFLAGQRVSVPTPIPLNTPIKIGTTSFELRR